MAGIFTRKAISTILNDENLTPEERTDQLFSLYGRALDDGYITKSAAQAATAAAVEEAKEQAAKEIKLPDVKESEEYKKLSSQFDAYKVRQEARFSDDFAAVKPKFFDAVYDNIDHSEGAKPISEQLLEIQKKYEEYFIPTPPSPEPAPRAPQFADKAEGTLPKGDGEGSFGRYWGYTQKG